MLQEASRDRREPGRAASRAQAEMVEALVAGEGLARVAEIAAAAVRAPVEILVPRPGNDGADGSAAERYVAALVAGELPERPPEVFAEAPIEAAGNLLGAVVMLGPGGEGAAEYLRAAAAASLTGVAMLNAREEASRRAEGPLIADLLGGRERRPGEIVRRALLRGCDLTAGLTAFCASPGDTPPERLLAAISRARPDALAEVCDGRVYALLPGPDRAERLPEELGEGVLTAHSSHYREASGARLALEEAEVLLALVEFGGRTHTGEPTWDTIRLLFRAFAADPSELSRFAAETVGAVLRHDEELGSELQTTFWAYQESNCNMNLTAKATYTHRHTVSNRLARIEELTGLDPHRAYDRELLSMALKMAYVVRLARPRLPGATGR